jgi:hypothetical protein
MPLNNFSATGKRYPARLSSVFWRRNVSKCILNGERKMPGTIIAMQKNLANCSELLKIVRNIFLSCLRNLRYVYIFQNTTHWKINSEKKKIFKKILQTEEDIERKYL